jgi:uncharacterized protein YaeQ
MVTRVLVYCLNVQEFLSFSKGLCVAEDPDILAKSLAGEYLLWIDVGEPAFERIKKACRQAQAVKVYSFNSKSDVWWQLSQKDFATLDVEVYQFQFSQIKALAGLLQRSMNLSLTLSGDSAYIAAELGECEITCRTLQAIEDL